MKGRGQKQHAGIHTMGKMEREKKNTGFRPYASATASADGAESPGPESSSCSNSAACFGIVRTGQRMPCGHTRLDTKPSSPGADMAAGRAREGAGAGLGLRWRWCLAHTHATRGWMIEDVEGRSHQHRATPDSCAGARPSPSVVADISGHRSHHVVQCVRRLRRAVAGGRLVGRRRARSHDCIRAHRPARSTVGRRANKVGAAL